MFLSIEATCCLWVTRTGLVTSQSTEAAEWILSNASLVQRRLENSWRQNLTEKKNLLKNHIFTFSESFSDKVDEQLDTPGVVSATTYGFCLFVTLYYTITLFITRHRHGMLYITHGLNKVPVSAVATHL